MQNVLRATTRKGKLLLQKLGRGIYPPLCMSCGEETDGDGLCGACWAQTRFITGNTCSVCSAPLIGDADNVPCDSCLRYPPAWDHGRAVAVYRDGARRIILSLKHGDRLDMVPTLARWMIRESTDLLQNCDLMAPVPLHRTRLLKRRFNQAAELSKRVSQISSTLHIPDLLTRTKRTSMQVDMTREERFENQRSAISLTPRYLQMVKDKRVLLIDDVMTTGATLSACAEACRAAGSAEVNVLVFARVAQDN